MDVTRENFESALQQFGALLPHADFCAIDCEFTGLAASDDDPDHYYDLPCQRWARAQQSAQQFLPLQIGLCLFTRQVVHVPHFDMPQEQWMAHPFNFFLWPTDSKRFAVQSNSLAFLVKHGFDLNRCVSQGIGWLSHQDEAAERAKFSADMRERLDQFTQDGTIRDAPSSSSLLNQPVECMATRDAMFVRNLESDIARWLSYRTSAAATAGHDLDDPSPIPFLQPASQYTSMSMRAITLSTWVPSHRQLVHQIVSASFPQLLVETLLHDISTEAAATSTMLPFGAPPLYITLPSEQERQGKFHQHMQRQCAQFDESIKQRVGFRQVIDLLSASQVAIVGHNALLDLAYVMHHFHHHHHQSESFDAWKARVHTHFPLVFDTKRIGQERHYQLADKTSLSQSVIRMNGNPLASYTPIGCAYGFSRYDLPHQAQQQQQTQQQIKTLEHEAGYDAYLTGHLFLRLMQAHSGNGSVSITRRPLLTTAGVPLWCPVTFFHAFANRIFLWLSPVDVSLVSQQQATNDWSAFGPAVCVTWSAAAAAADSNIKAWMQRALTGVMSIDSIAVYDAGVKRTFLRAPNEFSAGQLVAAMKHEASCPPPDAHIALFADYAMTHTASFPTNK